MFLPLKVSVIFSKRMMTSKTILFKYVFAICCSLPFCAYASRKEEANLTGKKLIDVCENISKGDAKYFVVDKEGVITNKVMAVGDVYEIDIKLLADDVTINTNHRLVVNRKGLMAISSPDLKGIAIKPTCPRTSEFKIFYNMSTRASVIGKYNENIHLSVDPPEGGVIDEKIKYSANIISPEIVWDESPNASIDARDFFIGKRSTFVLKLKNVGIADLIVKELKILTPKSWYSIDAKACNTPPVAPQASCDIVFNRIATPINKEGSKDGIEILSNFKLAYPGFGILWSTKKTEIEFSR